MVSTATATVLPLNWIHSKIISVAAFCIIGCMQTSVPFRIKDPVYKKLCTFIIPSAVAAMRARKKELGD